jgi:hypothetical protein
LVEPGIVVITWPSSVKVTVTVRASPVVSGPLLKGTSVDFSTRFSAP